MKETGDDYFKLNEKARLAAKAQAEKKEEEEKGIVVNGGEKGANGDLKLRSNAKAPGTAKAEDVLEGLAPSGKARERTGWASRASMKEKFRQLQNEYGRLSRRSLGSVTFVMLIALFLLLTRISGPRARGNDVVVGIKDMSKAMKGTSLIAACKDKEKTLIPALRTWLDVRGVDEIVLVDWGSATPLTKALKRFYNTEKVVVVDVESAGNWTLTRAYNLAAHYASYDKIIRVDCDYALESDFIVSHGLLGKGYFYAGRYSLAQNTNQFRLNGALVVKQSDFWKVAGYDERIQSYGWDDEDLYHRLETQLGLERRDTDYTKIKHLPHGVSISGDKLEVFGPVEKDHNRFMLTLVPEWSWKTARDMSSYEVESDSPELKLVTAKRVPASLGDHLGKKTVIETREKAVSLRLHQEFEIPQTFIKALNSEDMELLLWRLMLRYARSGGRRKPIVLFAHVMHGLGNRIRALGSCMAYAKNTGRDILLIWERDHHCSVAFSHLFSTEYPTIDVFTPKFPFAKEKAEDKSWLKVRAFNYMDTEPEAEKNEEIGELPDKHIYYKGAYIMNAPNLSSWNVDNAELQSLKPSADVQAIIDKMSDHDFSKVVSVHIRNRGLDTDIRGVNFKTEYTSDSAREMQYWREKSHYTNFVPKMEEILAEDPQTMFYVSSDTVEVLYEMKKLFPGKVLMTSRECDDRDECVKYALADLYLLAKGQYILGSNWSSFTEAAQRLGNLKGLLAGREFANEGGEFTGGHDQ